MKTRNLQIMLAVMAAASLAAATSTAWAQDSPAASTMPPTAVNAPVGQLSYGVSQILQLAQAKVGDSTIIAYIKNSGNSYALNTDQIIYLRQQGISDAVITTMLNQPRPAVAAATPTTPAPQPVASSTTATGSGSTITTASGSTATVAPTVTYVQPVPATTYYYQPYYYQPYYYPAYGWYPPVSFSFGWGWGWGGGWRGGWHR